MSVDYKMIGKRIKSSRKQLKMTQEELAEKLDISSSFESRMERVATKISLEMISRIAAILEVPITYFIAGTMEQSENFLLEELGDIVKEFDAIDKKLLLEIAKLIQIYKQQNL